MVRLSGVPARLAAALAAALALGLLTPGGGAVASPDEPPPVPVISWSRCPGEEAPRGMECGTTEVPLDYDDPTGPVLRLDLLRMPAADPARRVGTLFVNPGGPGGEATSFAAVIGLLLPPVIAKRFDIVGIDPRGVGASAPMRCHRPGRTPPGTRTQFPTTRREVRAWLARDRWVRTACREGGDPVVDHMSTADTARDMELVRRALGDDPLTYFGISYGTQLGTTYAAMFPDHVRAMILDGVLDPIAWSTGRPGQRGLPFSTRVGSHRGSWRELRAAFDACDAAGPRRCPIAGEARGVWDDVVHRLRRGPFQGITYADLVGGAAAELYSPAGVRALLRKVGKLHRAMRDGGRLGDAGAWRRAARDGDPRGPLPGPGPYAGPSAGPAAGYGTVGDAFTGVACADSDNPGDPWRWARAARRADREAPGFGSLWTWASSPCARWPEQAREDRFTGSYAVAPSAPVLVVGNTYDPATPITGARAVHRLLAGSRLLELRGYGHGALGSGPCIGRAYAAYLVEGDLPPAGAVCRPARPLFPR